MKAISGSFYQY